MLRSDFPSSENVTAPAGTCLRLDQHCTWEVCRAAMERCWAKGERVDERDRARMCEWIGNGRERVTNGLWGETWGGRHGGYKTVWRTEESMRGGEE